MSIIKNLEIKQDQKTTKILNSPGYWFKLCALHEENDTILKPSKPCLPGGLMASVSKKEKLLEYYNLKQKPFGR